MTKRDIIEAAFQVWGRTLYQHTSLEPVARALGVTKPALYRHFKNKERLWDGMYEYFFDGYAAAIRPAYEQALAVKEAFERLLIFNESVVRYYSRNMDAFLFALIKVYEGQEIGAIIPHFKKRGIDMRVFFSQEYNQGYPSLSHLTGATTIFWLAQFHKYDHAPESLPSDAETSRLAALIREKIIQGLGASREAAEGVDFCRLEELAAASLPAIPQEAGLLKAVAEAVAEAGPWKASMDMVARRSGLSKSGLYAHFKNKQAMLGRLFSTEFERLISYVQMNKEKSAVPLEKRYLAVIAIADYLRAKPDILAVIDWVRTQKLELGIANPAGLCQLLEGAGGNGRKGLPDDTRVEAERNAQWVLFLIVTMLMRPPPGIPCSRMPNESFRILFRFIGCGAGAFLQDQATPIQPADRPGAADTRTAPKPAPHNGAGNHAVPG
ncbi:MAG: TetR/AcrR family transcriptional regulator [Treponema sp.]|jgi:AcrR family transcriptional regulator|nr:TetR/AcrR family transcriptional regulator [Treponema sp.]